MDQVADSQISLSCKLRSLDVNGYDVARTGFNLATVKPETVFLLAGWPQKIQEESDMKV